MYDEQIIGKAGYKSIERVRSKIRWQDMAAVYRTKKSFDSVARRLVKKGFLSDDGKSMEVLYLDKLGVSYVRGHLKDNPGAIDELEDMLGS